MILPKLKKCPYCFTINRIKNKRRGFQYEKSMSFIYESLKDWVFKKKFNCRKCKIKLGYFVHKSTHREAVIWLDFYKYRGISKPFLKEKKYSFLKDTRKKNWSKKILKTISFATVVFFSVFLSLNY